MKTHHFWGNTWGKLELVLRRLEFLGLYSYLKVHFENRRRSSSFHGILAGSSIKRLAKLRITGYFAVIMLLFLSFVTISPIYIEHTPVDAASGTSTLSTLTYNAANTTASAKLNVTSKDGTFATSSDNEKIKFNIGTNNYTGYTLKVRFQNGVSLSNNSGNALSSISDSITASAFSADNATTLNNKWGYIPNYYNSIANSTNTYYPASTTDTILRKTTAANTGNSTDEYTIGLGLRADYTNPSGTYTSNNTLILEYVANPVPYHTVTLDGNGGYFNAEEISSGHSQSVSLAGGVNVPVVTGSTLSLMTNQDYMLAFDYVAGGTTSFDVDLFPDDLPQIIPTATTTNQTYNWVFSSNSANMGAANIRFFNDTVVPNPYTINITNIHLYRCFSSSLSATCSKNSSKTVEHGSSYGTLPELSREGYDFLGWFTAASGGSQVSDTTTVTEDVTYWAQWEKNVILYSSFDEAFAAAGKSKWNGTGYYAMQDMTMAICGSVDNWDVDTNAPTTQLVDTRDNKIYYVSKLRDGNCWMTQNLDLGSSAGDITLTPANSDVASNFTLTTPGSLDFSDANYDVINYRDPGEQYYVSSGTTDNDTSYISKSACESAKGAELCAHSHAGNYYNWYTATAGTGTQAMTSGEATSSICPAGWRLPTNSSSAGAKSYYNLLRNYDIMGTSALFGYDYTTNGFNNIRSNALYFIRSGYYDAASLSHAAGRGSYWSSSAYRSADAYSLYFSSSNVDPQDYSSKYNGRSVRCLARNTPVSLVVEYDGNTTATVSNIPANQTMSNFDGESSTLTISSTTPTRSGYGFVGWSTNPNAEYGKYQPGEIRYLSSSELPSSGGLKLYAIWSNKTYSITYDANGGTGSGFPWTDTKYSRSMSINFTTKPTAPSNKEFKGWSTNSAATTPEYTASGTTSYYFPDGVDNVTLYAVWGAACIIEGTPVNLPNGQKAPVETIADWQEGIAWDFENGTPTTSAFTPIDKDTTPAEYNVIYLHFSDGKKIGIVDEHWFFDADANQFVEFNNNNAEEYIGHHFVKVDGESWATNELVEVTRETKITTVYSPTTYEHVNFVVDDMLSMAGDLRGLFNYFEVDPITMAWDPVKKANDINKYGLTTLADFNGKIDQAAFDAFNVRYFNVSIGKGLMTWNTVDYYIEKYLPNLYMER